MKNAFDVVADFEKAVSEYTRAPYVVAVNSCTNAIGICLQWKAQREGGILLPISQQDIIIPARTYVGVPMQIKTVGYRVGFKNEDWQYRGYYVLGNSTIVDSARYFSSNMFEKHIRQSFVCTSHHWSKHLSTEQGGCILHDNKEFDKFARMMRFDGRRTDISATEDIQPTVVGMHCYMSPSSAALGLTNLMHLPSHNPVLPRSDYPDLSKMEIFK